MASRDDLQPSSKPKGVVAEALERFNRASEYENEQREIILQAKKFRAGNQWPDEVRQQRAGAPAIQGQAAQPQRPCLTIDRISAPVRIVSNMVRSSRFEIEFVPVGSGADKEMAEIYKGWARRIQSDARPDSPVEWAADQAAEGGLAWFRLMTYEVDEESFDQDLRLERVPNNLSIYCDPAAIKPTRSDARFMFATQDIPKSEFKRLYPDADFAGLDTFRGTGDTGDTKGWVTDDTYRIAEYWRVEYEQIRLVELNNGTVLKGDAIPKGLTKGDAPENIRRERTIQSPHVKWSKITATEELEKTDWLGSRIPFIPVLGEELNVDGKSIVRGVITPAMDAQRMVNYTFSAAVESAALAPKSPWIVAEGQIDQYKQIWQQSTTTNWTYLPYTPVSLLGSPVAPPQRNAVEQPIQAMVELMVRSEDSVKATTSIFDPSLGNTNPRERSGTAIQALQRQSEFGQSNYQDNVERAMTYAGELMIELGPKLLDRPGRIIQILQTDDTPAQVMLNQPFVPGENGGAPQPVNGPDGQAIMDPQLAKLHAGMAKFYKTDGGKYGVRVKIGRDKLTKRDEISGALGELIPHLPPPMQAVLVPEYIQSLDFADSQKMADMARKTLPPNLQQQDSNLPPAVQSAMAQKDAQIQQMGQALQQAKQIIDTDQVKADQALKLQDMKSKAELAKVKLEGTRDFLLANVNNAAKILVARIGSKSEVPDPAAQAAEEEKATGIQMAHEHYMKMLDQAHELTMSDMEHQQGLEVIAATPQPEPTGATA